MDKKYKVLYELNRRGFTNQRTLAKSTEISLGSVNSTLKKLVEEEYISKDYELLKKGIDYLEKEIEQNQEEKLSFDYGSGKVESAVILAAGANVNFDCPVGLLEIDGIALIEHSIRNLNKYGIEQICVVVGSQKEQYERYFAGRPSITLVENPRYKWTGTMASFAAAAPFIKGDFLLLEGNQLVEDAAIEAVLGDSRRNSILLSALSGSRDEVFVELDEDGSVFRISKDVRQMTHIDAEMVGVSKISYPMFHKMMEVYENNTNPLVNYEYVMEDIGRIYQLFGTRVDDLLWGVIENEIMYHKAAEITYSRICKKQLLSSKNQAREIAKECLDLVDDDIEKVRIGGGLTNSNFYIKTKDKEYILRVPGACTDVMINRKSEQHNSALAAALGISAPIEYFNAETGIKIAQYIPQAETLTGKTARMEKNIKLTTSLLKQLHTSGMKMYEAFSVQREYEKYKGMMTFGMDETYEGFSQMDQFFYLALKQLQRLGLDSLPCHNDLVAENFIKDRKGRLYLIDWEYSGYNDPMWDVAAHLLECEFAEDEEELFLSYYFQGEPTEVQKEKMLLFQILQDVLWSLWTMLKEKQGEDFGSYGVDRIKRGIAYKAIYEERYGKLK